MTPSAVLQVHAFFREGTGADRYFRDLSRLLEAHGHRVAPFCATHAGEDPSEWGRYFPQGSMTGVDERPGFVRGARDALKFLFHAEARRKAAEIVREFRPDVVHAHNLFHHLSPSVLGPLAASGAPVVMTLHDYKLICPNYTLHTQGHLCTACTGGRFANAVVRRCVRDSYAKSALCAVENTLHWRLGLYLRSVERFIAPSRFLAERFVAFGFPEAKLTVVPNFTPAADGPAPPEGDFALFAGRLIAIKGVVTLLSAWRRTRARRELRLLIAGGGPLEGELRRRIEDEAMPEVRILGPLPREELGGLMARAALQLVPSEWYEPCPLVVLEAAARGRCIVASRIGGIPEMIEDGVTGLLVAPGSEEDLASAIDAAALDPALRARLGNAARERVEQRHGPEAHYQAVLAAYRGVAG